ncbi:MAG: ROK family protein [Alphaproteobacteria bacterium]
MLTIGIDIGGSAAKLALVDAAQGEVLASDRVATGRAMAGDALAGRLVERVRALAGTRPLTGIGIGVPATVIGDRPIDASYCNVPALVELDLARTLAERLSVPAWMENDAKAALRGEWLLGAAQGARNAALITLGTGIGSALLLDGALRDGAHGNHGEIGLTMVGPPDGLRPLEQWAAPGFARDRFGADLPRLIAAEREGADDARRALDIIFSHLGTAVTNLHLLLDLEVVVLAGGVTGLGGALVDRVAQSFAATCPPIYRFGLAIRNAVHGELAGAVGAAMLAQSRRREGA